MLTFGSHPCRNNPREVVWLPPADGTIKVNVDGSSFGNPGRAGYGGLVRNNLGEWICGFYGSCGVADNLTTEIYAIMHGLDLAWNRGYRDVILETDSKSAIDLLNTAQAYHPMFPLLLIFMLCFRGVGLFRFIILCVREMNALT